MLDRKVVKEFLQDKLKDAERKVPKDINVDELVESFCQFTEDDLYEWLKDNYKSFFSPPVDGDCWKNIRERMKHHKELMILEKKQLVIDKMDAMDDKAFMEYALRSLGTSDLFDEMKKWVVSQGIEALNYNLKRIAEMEKERNIYVE